MYDRIREGWQERFRALLARIEPARADRAAERIVGAIASGPRDRDEPLPVRLHAAYLRARRRIGRLRPPPVDAGVAFCCDGGLGGLARWLRAAGHDAEWHPSARGEDLLDHCRGTGRVLLTTTAIAFRRTAVREGRPGALWVPTTLDAPAQARLVLGDLGLGRRDPRCMSCGGELRRVDKQAVLARIPPRTARWRDEYWLCERCDALVWRGTHWERIERELSGS